MTRENLFRARFTQFQELKIHDKNNTNIHPIGMREFGNLILLGSKPLPTAKAEVWACKILPAWLVKFCLDGLGKTITLGFYRTWHIHIYI
jgi:hypothetical protein